MSIFSTVYFFYTMYNTLLKGKMLYHMSKNSNFISQSLYKLMVIKYDLTDYELVKSWYNLYND